ncbi:MAG: matrixin family metalloprotease [Deltaproteobacteria bacterium]|nr:matrixin family metalloprotease [Deltaproteobacteria bacterium]
MRRHFSLALAGAALIMTSATAHAFVRMKVSGQNVKWQRLPVPYKINPTADPRITDGSDITAIKNGFKTWDDANCSDFTSSFAGDTSATAPVRNGQVEIMWPSTSGWVHGSCGSGGCTLAVTNSQFQSSGSAWYIYDADIEFTPYVQFATDGNRSRSDLQSVATHEIGHLLGLDHSPTPSATMYYATGPGDTSQRTLDTDDLNGVCAIYPNGATPIGCTSAAQCDSGQLCMNNACVPDPSVGGYGTACRSDGSCSNASGFCVEYQGSAVCTQACGSGCPNGDQCVSLQGGGNACIPGTGGPVTPPKQPFGGACTTGANCQSGECAANMCTMVCQTGTAGSCPGGFHCEVRPGGAQLCMPGDTPKTTLGGGCTEDAECASGICATSNTNPDDKFCTELCEPATGCPTDFACIDAGGGAHACVRDNTTPGGLGMPCSTGDQCNSAICVSAGYCSQICDPAAGCGASGYSCVSAGGGQFACAKDDDGGGSSGGCSVGPGAAGGGHGEAYLALGLLALGLVLATRRRK